MVDAGGNVGGKRLPTACLRHFNLNAKAQRTQRNAKETRTKGAKKLSMVAVEGMAEADSNALPPGERVHSS